MGHIEKTNKYYFLTDLDMASGDGETWNQLEVLSNWQKPTERNSSSYIILDVPVKN